MILQRNEQGMWYVKWGTNTVKTSTPDIRLAIQEIYERVRRI